nr:radical SAM protein [uncultured Desulfobacter sp.]
MDANYPNQLSVIVTNRCNLRCKLCLQPQNDLDIDPELLHKMNHVFRQIKWFHPIGGEPMLYDLNRLFNLPFGDQCKMKLITNGTLLTDKNVNGIVKKVGRLMISIDGGTQEAYRAMRGYDFNKVLKGVQRVQSSKVDSGSPTPALEFNCLLTKTTIESLPALAEYAAAYGVDCINTFYPQFIDPSLERAEKINRDEALPYIKAAKKHVSIIEPENRGGKICRRPWNTCFVNLNGDVTLCCFGSPVVGNLNKKSFDDIWFGKAATQIRKTVNTDREIPACRNCTVK